MTLTVIGKANIEIVGIRSEVESVIIESGTYLYQPELSIVAFLGLFVDAADHVRTFGQRN